MSNNSFNVFFSMCLVSLNENQWEQLCVFMNFPYWNETVNHSLKVFFVLVHLNFGFDL